MAAALKILPRVLGYFAANVVQGRKLLSLALVRQVCVAVSHAREIERHNDNHQRNDQSDRMRLQEVARYQTVHAQTSCGLAAA
jgi:hypothetical protein